MKTKIFFQVLAFLLMLSFTTTKKNMAQDYVVLNTFNVNLRSGPGTDYFVVCTAGKGEIFKLAGENGDWLEIEVFTSENRFVHRDLVYFLTEFIDGHNMVLPDSEEEIKEIYSDILWAKSQAKKDADEIIPVTVSEERHNNFLRIREDKHIHDIFEKHGVQTAIYPMIMEFAEKEKW